MQMLAVLITVISAARIAVAARVQDAWGSAATPRRGMR
jgi:hypothetical protein